MAFKSTMINFDFMGISPKIRVLNDDIYKSMPSCIISLIVVIFSLFFGIYSFVQFINQIPMIDYYQTNDFITNKTIKISDSFVMFQVYIYNQGGITNKGLSFGAYYQSSDEDDSIFLEVKPCEYGKNINPKYQELLKNFEKIEEESISDFFCVNFNEKNISFFHNPKDKNKKNYLRLIIMLNDSSLYLDTFSIKIVTENDILDHNNKENPIIPYYYYDTFSVFNVSQIVSMKYDFQYIKYESEKGVFVENTNIFNGVAFSSLSYSYNYNLEDLGVLAMIDFGVNKSKFDYYKRTYYKFQSYLADVLALINIIAILLQIPFNSLLNKKMNKDIIAEIMEEKGIKKYKEKIKICQNGIVEKLKDKEEKDKNILEFETLQNSKDFIKESNNIKLKSKRIIKRNAKSLKNLELLDIIKNLFCFKDIKTQVIDLCDEIINEDICIDKILGRLYNLEKISSLIEKETYENYIFNSITNFTKINFFLSQINHKTEINNNKNEETKKKNSRNK